VSGNQKEEIYVGLDIGSSKITTIVGTREGENSLRIIGVGSSSTTGLRKGVVRDVEETVSGITESFEIAERMAGVTIGSAVINVNGAHIKSVNSRGVVAVGKSDHEVTANDVLRAEEAALAIQMPSNREVLDSFPRSYSLDGQEDIKDPIGMSGVRLEVESHVVTVAEKEVRTLSKCVEQAGVKIEGSVFSPLAAANSVLTKRQKELGVILIDIGMETTGICVFEEGEIFYSTVLAVGAGHITRDIAIGLRISDYDIAEKIKIKFGNADLKGLEKAEIDLSEIDIKLDEKVTQKYLFEIMEPRLYEIFQMIRDELRKINRDGLLPGGAVLTGGGASLKNICEYTKVALLIPAMVGIPRDVRGISDKINDPMYATGIGLMLYDFEGQKQSPIFSDFGKTLGKLKKIFRIFLP